VFNLVKYRYAFLILSLVIIVPGFISLVLFHLDVGIDFLGGANMELRPQQNFSATQLTNALSSLKLRDLQIVPGSSGTDASLTANKTVWIQLNTKADSNVTGTITTDLQNKYTSSISVNSLSIPAAPGSKTFYTLIVASNFKTAPVVSDIESLLSKLPKTTTASSTTATTPVTVQAVKAGVVDELLTIQTTTTLQTSDLPNIQALVTKAGGPYLYLVSNSTVGPAVASQTTLDAIGAVAAAACFILLYVWFSFRKLPKAYRYGTCAIIAMLHDVLVVVGIFSILGKLFAVQVDSLFITALLTVVGFSVHDTIVVFDRIRENLLRRTSETFDQVVNASLVQTLARSLNTSLTVLFTLLALTLFTGAGSVHNFTLALLIGIFSGTYSSIFNASMLLVMWDKGEIGFQYLGGGIDHEPSRKGIRERELARARG
jgi:preprotein translocase SecF subunit